ALARDGALVVGVDLPAYLRQLDGHSSEACHNVVGDIETISRQIQREHGNTSYRTPIIAGSGEGGVLAMAILAQAPGGTIAGAVAYDPTTSVRRADLLGGSIFLNTNECSDSFRSLSVLQLTWRPILSSGRFRSVTNSWLQ